MRLVAKRLVGANRSQRPDQKASTMPTTVQYAIQRNWAAHDGDSKMVASERRHLCSKTLKDADGAQIVFRQCRNIAMRGQAIVFCSQPPDNMEVVPTIVGAGAPRAPHKTFARSTMSSSFILDTVFFFSL